MCRSQQQSRCHCVLKLLEKFLRQMTFNLGNFPSKTEVKVISCVPIDVTDLFKQIENLKTELKKTNPPAKPKLLNRLDYEKASKLSPSMESSNWFNVKTPEGILKKKITTFEEKCERERPVKKTKMKTKWVNNPHICYASPMYSTPYQISKVHPLKRNASRKLGRPEIKFQSSYLSNVVRKQYQSGIVFDDNVSSGAISVPLCRDASGTADTYMPTPTYIATDTSSFLNPPTRATRRFYDDQYYDVVPVKETSEVCASYKTPKKQTSEGYYSSNSIQYSVPEYNRGKKCCFFYGPFSANYISTDSNIVKAKSVTKVTGRDKHHRNLRHITKQRSNKENRLHTSLCRDTPCQANTLQPDQKQNEETLNQIKTILQTVLTEVKSNALSRNSSANSRKDAIVQKNSSPNDMRVNSSFIQCYNYTPYETYIPPTPPPAAQYKCGIHSGMCQPVFYQPSLVYSSSPQCPPIILQQLTKPACSFTQPTLGQPVMFPYPSMNITSTSTNTESMGIKLDGSNSLRPETKDLIKDIYKTLAVNIADYESGKTFNGNISKKFIVNQVTSESDTMKLAVECNAEIETRSIENSQNWEVTSSSRHSKSEPTDETVEETHSSSSDSSSTVSEKSTIITTKESAVKTFPSKDITKRRFGNFFNSVLKKKMNKNENISNDESAGQSEDYQPTVYSQEVTKSDSDKLSRENTQKHVVNSKAIRKYSGPINSEDRIHQKQWLDGIAHDKNQSYDKMPYNQQNRPSLKVCPVYNRIRVTELQSREQDIEDAEVLRRRVRFMKKVERSHFREKTKTILPWLKCRVDSWKQFIIDS